MISGDIAVESCVASVPIHEPAPNGGSMVAAAPYKSRIGVFKYRVPLDVFYSFVRAICPVIKTNNANSNSSNNLSLERTFFTLDISAFKRGIFMGVIEPFMQTIANEYYHERCRFYAERNMSVPAAYANFVQVIRHICKSNGIDMISSLKYEQSKTHKVYHIEQMRELQR